LMNLVIIWLCFDAPWELSTMVVVDQKRHMPHNDAGFSKAAAGPWTRLL
jgi:hypothetical protein